MFILRFNYFLSLQNFIIPTRSFGRATRGLYLIKFSLIILFTYILIFKKKFVAKTERLTVMNLVKKITTDIT